jgi:hypothetical protein
MGRLAEFRVDADVVVESCGEVVEADLPDQFCVGSAVVARS